ncbi:MAG: AIR carboxylase family protein [Arhodomonas sp.]|nr:AIR carboxylase family protein [Arhodomonas sp.]
MRSAMGGMLHFAFCPGREGHERRTAPGRGDHGEQVRLGDDAPCRRGAQRLRRRPRVRHRPRPPHAAASWREYARSAEGRGLRAIIAGAGRSPPTCRGWSPPRPCCRCSACRWRAAPCRAWIRRLSIVQMPGGVPTATFAIGRSGARNAALFAVSLLAGEDTELREALARFRDEQARKVMEDELP